MALPKGQAARNQLILIHKYQAEAKGLVWDLSQDECHELYQSNCYYCGAEPSNVYDNERCNGSYTYNGIDRVDNSKGYTLDNIVPCCKYCNRAKSDRSVQEFIEHCRMVVTHTQGRD